MVRILAGRVGMCRIGGGVLGLHLWGEMRVMGDSEVWWPGNCEDWEFLVEIRLPTVIV